MGPLQQLAELANHNCVRHAPLYPFEDEWGRFVDRERHGRPRRGFSPGNLISNSGETLRTAATCRASAFAWLPGFLISPTISNRGRLVRLTV